MRRLLAVTTLALAAVSAAEAFPRVRVGGVSGNFGYMRGGPGYWGSPYGYGFYDPFWYYGSFAHPGYFGSFAQGPGMGEVKLIGAPKDAMVYVDNAYAGEVRKLKTMWLEPGVYNLEVRDGDRKFTRRIYVLSGKTLDLKATPTEVASTK
ncbi:MAG: hypothetical protein SGI92_19115 [Bryobacteraceae bacterium]|nr:hypothetical protein [Bryobacteraceae bacterium]